MSTEPTAEESAQHLLDIEGTLETELWARLRHRHLAKAAG